MRIERCEVQKGQRGDLIGRLASGKVCLFLHGFAPFSEECGAEISVEITEERGRVIFCKYTSALRQQDAAERLAAKEAESNAWAEKDAQVANLRQQLAELKRAASATLPERKQIWLKWSAKVRQKLFELLPPRNYEESCPQCGKTSPRREIVDGMMLPTKRGRCWSLTRFTCECGWVAQRRDESGGTIIVHYPESSDEYRAAASYEEEAGYTTSWEGVPVIFTPANYSWQIRGYGGGRMVGWAPAQLTAYPWSTYVGEHGIGQEIAMIEFEIQKWQTGPPEIDALDLDQLVQVLKSLTWWDY